MKPGDTFIGRRVASLEDITQAGDYALSTINTQGESRPVVWFLLPIARDETIPHPSARAIHHVSQPPHRFRLCPDGSVEIRESIGAGPPPYYWHGYLDEGHIWRQV